MRASTVFVIALCAFVFVSSMDCKKVAKSAKSEKVKGKEAKVKTEKSVKVHKEVKAPVEKVVEVVVEEVAVVEEPVETHDIAEEVAAEEPHGESVLETIRPKISKPKALKVMSAYEECKMECRKQRDNVQAQEYVEQLRAELAAAETALEQEAASKAEAAPELEAVPEVAA